MSTLYSKIHYAVEITTSSSETAEDIGMYEGVIRFITDGYSPSDATYEDTTPVNNPTKWFQNFLTEDSLGSLGSRIDLTIGGDYAYLQTCNIKIVNYTTNNDQYHLRISDIFSSIITGAKVKIFVVINDVFYERWNGVITGTELNEDYYTFVCEDKFNNANDTLSGKTIGYVIGAEYTYFEAEAEPYAKNIILRRFGPYWYGTSHIHAYDDISGLTGHPLRLFNGFANSTLGDIEPTGVKWLQIEKNQYSLDFMNLQVSEGDLIRVNDSDSYYEILSWDTYTGTSLEDSLQYHIHINVKYFDKSLESFTACFTDANEFRDTTKPYEEIVTLADSARLSFYKKASGTGIPANMITGDFVTIVDAEGNKTNMTYTILDDGTIRLDDVAYTTKIQPTRVQIAKSNVPIDWFSSTLQSISDITFNDITLSNSLNKEDYFTHINEDDSSTNNMRTSLFKLTFSKDILEQGGWKLGLMVKGIFENQNMNWDGVAFNTGIGWYNCQESQYWNNNPATPINTIPEIRFGDAEHLSGARFNNYKIQVFKIVTVYDQGVVKDYLQEVDDFYLPNVVNTTSIVSNNIWDKLNVKVESVVATNVLQTDPEIYSTESGIRHLNQYPSDTVGSHYIQDALLDHGDSSEIEEFEFIISITGTDKDLNSETAGGEKTIKLTDSAGIQTTFVTDPEDSVPHLSYTLNGFSLYRTELVDTSGSKISIIQNDVATNSYPTTLSSIVDQTCDFTNLINRDDWLTGIQIKTPTPRFNIVTEMCKAGFVAGFTSRKGIPTFTSFIESNKIPHIHNNDLIVDNSIKSFTTTPISKVFNEFNLKWNLNSASGKYLSEIKILNSKEQTFPAKTENWTDYVSGIENYTLAESYWKMAHAAYTVSKATNKAPNDRTNLNFCYDNNQLEKRIISKYITTEENIITLSENLGEEITMGCVIKFPYTSFIDESFIKIGDKINLTDGVNYLECLVEADRVTVSNPKYMCRVIKTTFDQELTTIDIDTSLSFVYLDDGEIIAGTRFLVPPTSGGNSNQLEMREINQEGIGIGSICFSLKTSFPSSALINNTYRLAYYDENEIVNCYADVKIVGEIDSLNWKLEIINFNGTFIQPYANYFYFTGESSWDIQYFKNEYDTAMEFKDNKYISDYLELLLNWTTYQKFQVNYDLPITTDTIKYELSDRIEFKDPIITPGDLIGEGWITSMNIDTKKNIIKLQITFTPEFLVRPPVAMVCNNIIEHKDNIDTITEDKTNTNTITERYCPYSN